MKDPESARDPEPGRWRATTAVYESILPRGLREVALAHAYFANDRGGNVFPAVGRLARMVGCSGRNVQFARADLNWLGVLVIEANPGGRQKTSRFRLDLHRLAELTPADLAALAAHKQQQRRTTRNPEARFTVSSANPEAGFTVYDTETLKPATGNHEAGGPKPRNQRPETLKPTSPDPKIPDPQERSEPARTAASAASARERSRRKVFAGIRLQVSERQHAVVLNDLGADAALLDLPALYARWDAELADSGVLFDALALIKRRARETVAALRRSGTFSRQPVDDDERAARDEERRRREDEHAAQVSELWRLADETTRESCRRDAGPEIKPFAPRMTHDARQQALEAAACRIYAARFPTRDAKLRELERLRLQRAGAAS